MFFRTGSTGSTSFSQRRSTCYSDRLHDFYVTTPRCYANSFFPHTASLWNSLPIECFCMTYNLNRFKSRINKYLLTIVSLYRYFLYALIFRASFSCNSMPCSGCPALHRVNSNYNKYPCLDCFTRTTLTNFS